MNGFEWNEPAGHVTGMLYGKVGERIVGAVRIMLPSGPAWDALKGAKGPLVVKTDGDCMPDASINLLDRADISDITNSTRILSISGTPVTKGQARFDAYLGELQIPMSFEVHVREAA